MPDDRLPVLTAKLARIESGELKFADENSKQDCIARTKLFISEIEQAEKSKKGASK